jgi:hypothetical protein
MGMGERKTRSKQFKQKTDETGQTEIHDPNLFSEKPVEGDLTIECVREPEDAPVEAGQSVRLVDMKTRIDVFRGVKTIGYVVTGQLENLRATLRLPDRKGRSIQGRVIEVSELTPTFIVHIKP